MERGVSSVPENNDRILAAVLAMEIGGRGVTVNSILPTGIEGGGVFSEGCQAGSQRICEVVPTDSARGHARRHRERCGVSRQ
jgi:hypothetical protein